MGLAVGVAIHGANGRQCPCPEIPNTTGEDGRFHTHLAPMITAACDESCTPPESNHQRSSSPTTALGWMLPSHLLSSPKQT